MIFEAEYTVVKKALMTIQNALTGTEWNKAEFTTIEVHVEEEEVYIAYQGEASNQLEYQMTIADAEPILEGHVLVDVKDLLDVIKSFDKNAGVLLFELDGVELMVDDGVHEPEIIILSPENELEDGFTLVRPTESIILSKSWFAQRMELARLNNKTTFLPATTDVAFHLEDNTLRLRSFNLTNLYESKLLVDHSLSASLFLMGKNASSRLSRLLKSVKEDKLHLYMDKATMYVFNEDFVFRFYGEEDDDGKAIFTALPIEAMAESTDTASFKTSELKKLTKVAKGEDPPESIGCKWENETIRLDIAEDSEEIFAHHYPFKSIQKIASKWMANMELGLGIEENNYPLILVQNTNETEDVMIMTGMEPEPLNVQDEFTKTK